MKKQQEKSQQTRLELEASAISLFGQKGFTKTSIAEITAEAGYSKGCFYRHWESKGELFLKIIEGKLKSYREQRDNHFPITHDLDEAMGIIWDFLETIIDDQDWSRIFLEFTMHATRNETLRQALNQGAYRLSNELFAALVGNHVNSGYPAEKIGALNTALFEGFLIHSALGTGVLDKTDVRQAALTLARANGLKPQG
ncbi:TetR/AcrR family transcriptional regulator [Desulfovibrio ferrophilus]|uniref:TetR family transcriptional regulator n=1 Tax=Desulfovibrio ferrophilus TaxID=241368 RepID=A0A2Z6B3L9_9BACT|nr:TetR family transcriptional regulator [Desulfovibrio ferrophilus]